MEKKQQQFSVWYFLGVVSIITLLHLMFFNGYQNIEIPYSKFMMDLQADSIQKVVLLEDYIYGTYKVKKLEKDPEVFAPKLTPWSLDQFVRKSPDEKSFRVVRVEDAKLTERLEAAGIEFHGEIQNSGLGVFFRNWILPFIFLSIIWSLILRRFRGNPALNLRNSMGSSNTKIVAEDPKNMVKFDDVAGIDEVKAELYEVVDFLTNSEKYEKMGAHIPKGLLLMGPPGTGKTFVAKAVAGEAGVPFFNISGSDFVEMFVGLGAARVRDLFKQAKEKAPCIIFIDEIDAIGKSRANNTMGGNDERENTLNQLLVEMDGFGARDTVILLAATNRPEVLDKALLRPGRFDRQIHVMLPDIHGREAILAVHSKKVKLALDSDLSKIAAHTAGFSGADLANLVNEAALQAVRKKKNEVEYIDFMDAFERIIAGLEKKKNVINEHERKIVAYHESGHAIIGYFTPGADPIRKVSIVPRSIGALGYVLQTPTEDRFLMTRKELEGKIKGLLGGRAAEEIIFDEVSTGASNDLEKVTNIVRAMVTQYGMSKSAPNVSLVERGQGQFLGGTATRLPISDKLEEEIDREVIDMLNRLYEETKELLKQHKDKLEEMASVLLEKEVLTEEDVVSILGGIENYG